MGLAIMKAFRIYLLCAAALASTAAGAPIAGPYIVYAESFYTCEGWEESSLIQSDVKFSPFNIKEPFALQTINGTTGIKQDMDDTFWGHVKLDARSSNHQRWVKNALIFKFPGGVCSNWRKQAPDFNRAILGEGSLRRNPCVIKKGLYIHKNEPVNWTFPSFPIVPYGHYRFFFTSGKEAEREHPPTCVSGIVHVIPQPKRDKYG